MSPTLRCACGQALAGETGEDLFSAVEAHLERDHRELLVAWSDASVAQLDDEALRPSSYVRRVDDRLTVAPEPEAVSG